MKRDKYYGVCADCGVRVYMAAWGRDDTEPVAARLRAARQAARIGAPQMAKLLRVNRSTVWRWEHGVIESMSLENVQRWGEVTEVPYHWIIEGGPLSKKPPYDYLITCNMIMLRTFLKTLPSAGAGTADAGR